MYGDHGLHIAEEIPFMEPFLQINGNQPSLPVMAVHDIRPEIHQRQRGQNCLGKVRVFFNLKERILPVGLEASEIMFIINKVILLSLIHISLPAPEKPDTTIKIPLFFITGLLLIHTGRFIFRFHPCLRPSGDGLGQKG